ncbi:MAG TPA: hypothetical protein VK395_07360 [Gemmataceae bacterium]|nr:hypothetical protein [Gemmataceae bacterium]
MMVVLNLESGAVVFVGDDQGTDALKPFWNRQPGSKVTINAVAIHLSKATTVNDHFQVIKLFNGTTA